MSLKLKQAGYGLLAVALIAGSGIYAPTASATSSISTFEALDTALCEGGEYVLGGDIAANGWLASGCEYKVTKDVTIDFNGHTITSDDEHSYNLDVDGATLTFKDSIGGGGYIQEQADGSTTSGIAITNGKLNLQGGLISGGEWTVILWHDSELNMSGGKIHASTGFAITGNGTTNPSHNNYGSNVKMNITGGEIISDSDFAIYNPSENSAINISNATISGSSGAIAANRGTITINSGELKSLGTSEVEGDVSQDGSRGYTNAVIGIPKEYGPVTLNINGGRFIAQGTAKLIADISGLDNTNVANITIAGGTFSANPGQEYIVDGYTIYEWSGDYIVSENPEFLCDVDGIYLQVGESIENLPVLVSGAPSYYISTEDETIAKYDRNDYTLKGIKAGKTEVSIDTHDIMGEDGVFTLPVYVYEVAKNSNDDTTEEKDEDILKNEVSNILQEFINGENKYDSETDEWTNEKVRIKHPQDVLSAIKNGKTLVPKYDQLDALEQTNMLLEALGEDALTLDEFVPLLLEEYGEIDTSILNDRTIAAVYSGNIYIRDEEGLYDDLGEILELDKEISLAFDIPEAYRHAPEGYTRTFSIIRAHKDVNGNVTLSEINTKRDGDKVITASNLFSEFILTYTDEKDVVNPNTFDKGGLAFAIAAGTSIPMLIWGAYLATKRN